MGRVKPCKLIFIDLYIMAWELSRYLFECDRRIAMRLKDQMGYRDPVDNVLISLSGESVFANPESEKVCAHACTISCFTKACNVAHFDARNQ